MEYKLSEDIIGPGYTIIRERFQELTTIAVASKIGQPVTPWEGGLVQRLMPRAYSTPNTYSGIYGLGQFPFHTDLAHWREPPRYLLLRCIKGYIDVKTLLIDGHGIIKSLPSDLVARAIVKPRRPQNNKIHLLHLFDLVNGGYRIRWDDVFIRPASKSGEFVVNKIKDMIDNSDAVSVALVNKGDTIVIDNWRMLHARSPIPVGLEDRVIERVYLESLK